MALELMIGAYVEWRHHRDVIAEVGESYKTTTSTGDIIIRAHPQVAMRDRAFNNICKMMSEFGMTPASRAKVSIDKQAEEDPFEAFLKKRK
ncbi:TPA: phage terminase small subunit P27 family [Proteus mirabilis]|nr:phage terminase small subunit P27 family [Proteus mirabilis]